MAFWKSFCGLESLHSPRPHWSSSGRIVLCGGGGASLWDSWFTHQPGFSGLDHDGEDNSCPVGSAVVFNEAMYCKVTWICLGLSIHRSFLVKNGQNFAFPRPGWHRNTANWVIISEAPKDSWQPMFHQSFILQPLLQHTCTNFLLVSVISGLH